MPRIYSKVNHNFNQGAVSFKNGAASASKKMDIEYFEKDTVNYEVDQSKDNLEIWDRLSCAEIDELYEYLGGTVVTSDTKYQKVRKIETLFSSKLISSLTIASAAGTATGDSKITITSPGTSKYFAKTAKTTAASLLYGDVPDKTWTELILASGAVDITPTAADDNKITVVRLNSRGKVDAIASTNLTVKS